MNISSWTFCAAVIAALSIAHSASAQTENSSDPVRTQTTILKAGSYVDTQEGKLIRPAVIIVNKGRITAINPPALPQRATVVDLGELTLVPGLIDVHTHLMIGTNVTAELIRRAKNYSETDFLFEALQNGYKTLLAGFTTVRDLDSWYFVDVSLSKRSEEEALSLPRIIPAGHGINKSSPADFSHIFPPVESLPRVGIADTISELIESVDYQAAMGAGVIKLYGTVGFTMSESSDQAVGPQTYSDDEVEAVVKQARKHSLKVAAHAHGSEGIMASVKAGVASIEHGSVLTDEVITKMKAQGIFLVPTTPIMNRASLRDPNTPPKGIAVIKNAIQSHKLAIKSGVKIAYGTDAGLYPHGQNADGFLDLVDYGMSPFEALKTATVNAAELIGVDDRGSIEIDKLADIIAVNGNPLEDVSLLQNVVFVMKDGRTFKLEGKP